MWHCWSLLGWQGISNYFGTCHHINIIILLQVGPQLTGRDSFYNGAVLVHQSMMDLKDAEEAGAPILALPSKDEPDLVINSFHAFFVDANNTHLYRPNT